MRILILIAIGLLIYLIIKRLWNGRVSRGTRQDTTSEKSDDLVQCQSCGIHVLQSEAIPSAQNATDYYCCVEHQETDSQKNG